VDPKLLAVAINVVATEHFFTFSLSSLPTTKRFFANVNGRQDVREAYLIASALSLAFAVFLAIAVKSGIPVVSTAILILIFIALYEKALAG